MFRSSLCVLIVLLVSCATFDKTNIQPGQRVTGLGFSFTVPTEKSWFAVVYGDSHRIRLSQLNDKDAYSIQVALNQGPFSGMYLNAEAHLKAVRRHKQIENAPIGFERLLHNEWIDTQYGKTCVRYNSVGKDYRGRLNKGPAIVEKIGLTCAHKTLDNVLISFEFTRRSDEDAIKVDAVRYAEEFFASVEYESVD